MKKFNPEDQITLPVRASFIRKEAKFEKNAEECPLCKSVVYPFRVPTLGTVALCKTIFCGNCLSIIRKPFRYGLSASTDSPLTIRYKNDIEETIIKSDYANKGRPHHIFHQCRDGMTSELISYDLYIHRVYESEVIVGLCYECKHCNIEQYIKYKTTRTQAEFPFTNDIPKGEIQWREYAKKKFQR